jgi:uncharacterized protein
MRASTSLPAVLAPFVPVIFGLSVALVACGGTDNDFSKKPTTEDPDNGPVDTNLTKPLRIGNYNTRNFFNDVIDGETDALQLVEPENTLSTADYQKKLADVSGVLAELDADVVVLAEIENEAVLKDLIAQPALGGAYATTVLVPGNDPRGIDIGVISRFPIANVVSHKEQKIGFNNEGFSRDCLEVHIDFNSRDIVLLGIHFRSQSDDKPEKRLAEAVTTRQIADSLALASPRAGIVVLGDFNDTPGSAPIDAIEKGEPPYTDAVSLLPAADAWTVSFSGKEIFDDQWVNPIMAGFRDASSVTVIHGRTDVSDHAPVAVTYQITN